MKESDKNAICRICVEMLDPILNYDLFIIPDLADKLHYCASLEANPDDGYPRRICAPCYNRLNDLHEFVKMCREAKQRFDTLAQNPPLVGEKFVKVGQQPTDNDLCDSDPLITASDELIEEEPQDTQVTEPSEDDEEDIPLAIRMRKRLASKKSSKQVEEQRYENGKPIIEWKEENLHFCPSEKCSRGYATEYGLSLHVSQAHTSRDAPLPCPEEDCPRRFDSQSCLSWHLTYMHKISQKTVQTEHPCNFCDKVFSTIFSLKKHMTSHTGDLLPYECTVCPKRFVTNAALKDHLLRHASLRNHTCAHCGVHKNTRQELKAHLATHSNDKKHKCDICNYETHNKQNIIMHTRLVHKKRWEFGCRYCGKTDGPCHNECKMHERTPSAEKNCECKICGNRFKYQKSLSKHMQIHETNNKEESIMKNQRQVERVGIEQSNPIASVDLPDDKQKEIMMKEGVHVCPECGHGFNLMSYLRRHHRTVHQGIKNFICRFCSKRFGKLQTMLNHEMTHTGERPHACTLCDMRFIQKVGLMRHMKVHQKEI